MMNRIEALRELRAALLALPNKRLISGDLEDANGDVCSVGAFAKHKGLDVKGRSAGGIGKEMGIPQSLVVLLVNVNDWNFHSRVFSPEGRYAGMLAWVESRLAQKGDKINP